MTRLEAAVDVVSIFSLGKSPYKVHEKLSNGMNRNLPEVACYTAALEYLRSEFVTAKGDLHNYPTRPGVWDAERLKREMELQKER